MRFEGDMSNPDAQTIIKLCFNTVMYGDDPNPDSISNLFNTVVYRPSEDPNSASKFETLAKEFIFFEVREKTGLSLLEYTDMSRYKRNVLLSLIEDKNKEGLAELEGVENGIK